ncbi:hypothetical protein FQA39_LY00253 [Lamprigera yunnana]|nr:hypothetical protein FQA39_LY00253 [Lamprigera yunnana]
MGKIPIGGAICEELQVENWEDLVKEHLLYTVHEEVGVLKDRISVLLDRITSLERENHFLKANAAPDVLRVLYTQPLNPDVRP